MTCQRNVENKQIQNYPNKSKKFGKFRIAQASERFNLSRFSIQISKTFTEP